MEKKIYQAPTTEQIKLTLQSILIGASFGGKTMTDGGQGNAGDGGARAKGNTGDDWEDEGNGGGTGYHFSLWD